MNKLGSQPAFSTVLNHLLYFPTKQSQTLLLYCYW